MRTKVLFTLLFGISILLTSCFEFTNGITGNGNVQTEMREVSDFKGIEVAAGLKVFVEFGEMSNEIEVVADENLHEYIITEVINGNLRIKSRRNIRRASSRDIFVKAGNLERINVSSAADFIGENHLSTEDMDINVSSAGDLELELDAETLFVNLSSSGSADLKGSTTRLVVDVSSAADLDAFDLVAEEVNVNASSAAHAKVHARRSINANASSAGSIRYKGSPEEKDVSTSSAGSISGD